MASTVDFHNLIRRVIKHGETFYPVAQGFQFAVTDTNPVWYPTSGVPIPCLLAGSSATDDPPFLRFYYDYTSGTRYYLPTGGGQIERIRVFCKYGSSENPFTLIHEADISDEVTYDDNDYIDTITIKINIDTHKLELSQQIARYLDNNLSTGKLDLKPNKFKIYDSTFHGGSSSSYESPAYVSTDDNGVSVATQLGALGLNDDLSVTVLFSNIEFAGETISNVLNGPTKYRLFTVGNMILDEGNIDEGSETSSVLWKQNDSIKFTYTNNVLDQQ